ncbi:SixA phosphatase family protein [Allosphingosinicella sp.]|jgi:phosphohistidine phosphatase|uniref:SixA phosphatase family protein n=1 Tax=Allosphingosinicella sp. TaxID=2823234 RepID=UPI002EED5BA8
MKTLTLLRHAKSTWDDLVARDFDRPLNPRGRKAARRVGAEMRAQGLSFDSALASPAKRVVETLNEVAQGYGRALPVRYEQRVYLAAPETLLELVRATGENDGRLLLVGHNPGMEIVAMLLTRERGDSLREEVAVKYPTGTLAEISLPVERWRDVRPGMGRIERFIRPRDLDPELGPDEDTD